MRQVLARTVRGIRWCLREATGEARWDDYVEHCRRHGHPPMSRRDFERQRADAKESNPQPRCC